MKHIFVDTSGWAAIADGRDSHHEVASLFSEEIAGQCRLVVSDYVLDELYTLLLLNLGYPDTVAFKRRLDTLMNAGILDVVWVSPVIAVEVWTAFEQFNTDKQWSFTDCTSYVIMKQRNIAEAFAFDHHFVQMGFTCRP